MANLPASVQAQIDEADRIVQELSNSELNPVEPELQVPLESENIVDEDTREAAPTQEEAVSAPEEQSFENRKPRKGKSVSDSEETWEQRYRSLNGMYAAEVPKLHAQVKELTTQVGALMGELTETKQAAAEATPPKQITDEDREAFGADLVDLIERAAESKISDLKSREKTLLAELEGLKGRVGEVSEKQVLSERDRFTTGLSTLAPNWETLNVDPGFLGWLQEVDQIYGIPRQLALNTAYEALDAVRVAQIFNAYAGQQTPVTQQRPNQELRRQVAPSTSRASAAPVENSNSKIFAQQEIEQFYNDWRRGYIDSDEAARIEREIHAAAAEGRIR